MTNQTKPNQINQKQGNAFNILSFFQPIPWMHSKWLLELLEVLASQADATWLICCVMAGIPQKLWIFSSSSYGSRSWRYQQKLDVLVRFLLIYQLFSIESIRCICQCIYLLFTMYVYSLILANLLLLTSLLKQSSKLPSCLTGWLCLNNIIITVPKSEPLCLGTMPTWIYICIYINIVLPNIKENLEILFVCSRSTCFKVPPATMTSPQPPRPVQRLSAVWDVVWVGPCRYPKIPGVDVIFDVSQFHPRKQAVYYDGSPQTTCFISNKKRFLKKKDNSIFESKSNN